MNFIDKLLKLIKKMDGRYRWPSIFLMSNQLLTNAESCLFILSCLISALSVFFFFW